MAGYEYYYEFDDDGKIQFVIEHLTKDIEEKIVIPKKYAIDIAHYILSQEKSMNNDPEERYDI